jgi:hypothetical protein
MRTQQRAGRRSTQTLLERHNFVNSYEPLAALVVNSWVTWDAARVLSPNRVVDVGAIARSTPWRVKHGVVVGLRPNGTRTDPTWRDQVRSAGLSCSDHSVVGGELEARRLTFNEVLARAAEYATAPGVDMVAMMGVTDLVDPIAEICHRHGKLLVVAGHPRTALWSYSGAADLVVELANDCFPTEGTTAPNVDDLETSS